MSTHKHEKAARIIRQQAAAYVQTITNHTSLITFTRCTLSPDFRNATLYISVMPRTQEKAVLDFLNRNRTEMRAYVTEHSKLRVIPFLTVAIDEGEKHRQRLDEVSRTIENEE